MLLKKSSEGYTPEHIHSSGVFLFARVSVVVSEYLPSRSTKNMRDLKFVSSLTWGKWKHWIFFKKSFYHLKPASFQNIPKNSFVNFQNFLLPLIICIESGKTSKRTYLGRNSISYYLKLAFEKNKVILLYILKIYQKNLRLRN